MLLATAGGGGGFGAAPPAASTAAADDCDGDEAFARALQREEEQARLMALAGVVPAAAAAGDDDDAADPDTTAAMSYEQLTALGDAVGTVSRGASDAARAGVAVAPFSGPSGEPCIICQHDLIPNSPAAILPCGHAYHGPCIDGWLARSKACPLCGAEVE